MYGRILNGVLVLCGRQSRPLGGERRPVLIQLTFICLFFVFSVFLDISVYKNLLLSHPSAAVGFTCLFLFVGKGV